MATILVITVLLGLAVVLAALRIAARIGRPLFGARRRRRVGALRQPNTERPEPGPVWGSSGHSQKPAYPGHSVELRRPGGRAPASAGQTDPIDVAERAFPAQPAGSFEQSPGPMSPSQLQHPEPGWSVPALAPVPPRLSGPGDDATTNTQLPPDRTSEPTSIPATRVRVPREALISSSRAWLTSTDGAEILLNPAGTTIGRSATNAVTLDDLTVSRHHATLHHEAGAWWLTPDVTRHGTFCNDVLVQPADRIRVYGGDILRFGLSVLIGLRIPPAKVTFRLDSVARTTPGRRRENQDAHIATPHVLAVADGVGGRPAGRAAAAAAVRVAAISRPETSIQDIVAGAHASVIAAGTADPRKSGLAATLDIARLRNVDEIWQLEGAHVGDGHAFIQDADGVRVLTTVDTVGARMEKKDPALAKELRSAGSYDDIVAALGFPAPVHPQVWLEPAVAGTRVVLVSDGLVNAIGFSEVVHFLQNAVGDSNDVVADGLIDQASAGADNATVVIATIASESGLALGSDPGQNPGSETSYGSARGR